MRIQRNLQRIEALERRLGADEVIRGRVVMVGIGQAGNDAIAVDEEKRGPLASDEFRIVLRVVDRSLRDPHCEETSA